MHKLISLRFIFKIYQEYYSFTFLGRLFMWESDFVYMISKLHTSWNRQAIPDNVRCQLPSFYHKVAWKQSWRATHDKLNGRMLRKSSLFSSNFIEIKFFTFLFLNTKKNLICNGLLIFSKDIFIWNKMID